MLDPDVTETGVALAQSEQTGVFYAVRKIDRYANEFELRAVGVGRGVQRMQLERRERPHLHLDPVALVQLLGERLIEGARAICGHLEEVRKARGWGYRKE